MSPMLTKSACCQGVTDSERRFTIIDPSSCLSQAGLVDRKEIVESDKVVVRSRLHAILSSLSYSLQMRRLQELFLRSPAWLLGVPYEAGDDEEHNDARTAAAFLDDFHSRIWFTYRKDFAELGDSKLTSDAGWGCMLRSAQMLLAQALVCHRLGRSWRRSHDQAGVAEDYVNILRLFEEGGQQAALSLHRLVEAGRPHGLAAGAWVGPYALCRSVEALAAQQEQREALGMAVLCVASDARGLVGGAPNLSPQAVTRLCLSMPRREGKDKDDASWRPLLLLVPLTLGINHVNERYVKSLQSVLTFPQSLGIVGGKPGASTYLVGSQGDHAFVLDPHEVHQVAPLTLGSASIDTSSYHCSAVRRVPFEALDPSLALGFYCRTEGDFEDLCSRASKLADASGGAPMFTVGPDQEFHSKPADEGASELEDSIDNGFEAGEEGGWQLL
eukprot:jgi/Mesen1/6706/ME000344S05990